MPFEEDLVNRLIERFRDAIREAQVLRPRRVKVVIDRERIRPLCLFLRDEMGFEHISCISAVDRIEFFECVYHITSYANKCMVQVAAIIPHDDPSIDTVEDIWKGANYHEREAWDLMGIEFEGHPDLRRILLPQDFGFHPLRKDYKGE